MFLGSTLSRRNVFVVLYLSKERQKSTPTFFAISGIKIESEQHFQLFRLRFYMIFLDLAPFRLKNAQKDEKNELLFTR